MEKTCAVSLKNICKSFGGVQVLKNVNFELQKGEVHALVGGNGAGKSTLMKILNGAYVKDSGTVQVEGKVVEYHSIQDAWKCGVRMIYQELSLSPTLTVYENIFLAREMKKGFFLDKESMKKRTSELLNELKIEATPNDIIADLPVGTCQLIEIAKALATDAQVLILDEPTASLTERETQILFDRVRQLKNNGISIVYISHRMKEIFQIADRISILKDGAIGKVLSFKTTFGHGGPETWTIDKKNVWFFDKRFSAFGAMADLGVHKTDLLIFLLETKVKKVTAVLKTLDKKDAEGNLINVDDNAICIYEMENGAVGTMTASWTYYGEEDNSTIIYGSEGILKIYDDPNYSIVRIGKDGTKIYYELDKMQTNDNQTKSGIIDSWVAAIKNDTVPEVNGKDALDAMKAIFAALESSESGQTVEITEED